jgi:peptidoglycan/LPS O-acetylase OafA/YrhL
VFERENLAETPQEDLSSLNGVRLLIVTLIGIGYASTMAVGPGSLEWLNTFGYDPSLYGIQVLFFLSGWLAWRSVETGRSLRAFIATRARNVLPWVALYTGLVAAVLYPVLCDHDAPVMHSTVGLVLYVAKTVTLVQPGQPMPGALDGALYACNLQGTIWTLRWGAIAYAAFLVLHALKMRSCWLFLGLLVMTVAAHVGVNGWADMTGSDRLDPLVPGLRVAMAFLAGVSARQFAQALPQSAKTWGLLATALIAAAAIHYYFIPWTYAIELIATAGWCALAMAFLKARLSVLTDWPNLVLPLYLGTWPAAQTWLFFVPEIDVPVLVVASLTTSWGLALAFSSLVTLAAQPFHRGVQAA